MTCRGFQYKEGETYTEDHADLCNRGFHACANPLDCLQYYHPAEGAVYHEVELDGVTNDKKNDTKICGKKIRIGAPIDLETLIRTGVDMIIQSASQGDSSTSASQGYCSTSASQGYCSTSASQGDYSTSASQGYCSTSASQGYCSTSASLGDCSTSASQGDCSTSASKGDSSTSASQGDYSTSASIGNSSTSASKGTGSTSASQGDYSTSTSQGDYSTSTSQGNSSTSTAEGKESIAAAFGRNVKARASKGSWIVLSEIDEAHHIVDIQAHKVDGKKIKADTWYKLSAGKLVKVE